LINILAKDKKYQEIISIWYFVLIFNPNIPTIFALKAIINVVLIWEKRDIPK
jgi:hypothetical protein